MNDIPQSERLKGIIKTTVDFNLFEEHCPHCDELVHITPDKDNMDTCPVCAREMLVCSNCPDCVNPCPYELIGKVIDPKEEDWYAKGEYQGDIARENGL